VYPHVRPKLTMDSLQFPAIRAEDGVPPVMLRERLGDYVPIDFCGSVISLRIFDDRVTVKQVVLSGVWKDHRDRGHPPNGCQCAKRI
jgi:hypothetical protein